MPLAERETNDNQANSRSTRRLATGRASAASGKHPGLDVLSRVVIGNSNRGRGPYDKADLLGPLSEAGSLAAKQYLAATEQELTAKGARVRTTIVTGRPHMAISPLCDVEAVDLVVMTTHGRSGVSRWTMGSVADKILRTTNTRSSSSTAA